MKLSKQRVIMHRTSYGSNGSQFHEDLDEPGIARGFKLSKQDHEDMGFPEVITVTIEPGDLLNDEPA